MEEKILLLLQDMSSEIKDIKKELHEVKTDVAELKTDVAELKTDVAELKTDVAQLKTDVAELKTDVAQLKTDVKQLYANQETFEKKLDIIYDQMKDLTEFRTEVREEIKKLNSITNCNTIDIAILRGAQIKPEI